MHGLCLQHARPISFKGISTRSCTNAYQMCSYPYWEGKASSGWGIISSRHIVNKKKKLKIPHTGLGKGSSTGNESCFLYVGKATDPVLSQIHRKRSSRLFRNRELSVQSIASLRWNCIMNQAKPKTPSNNAHKNLSCFGPVLGAACPVLKIWITPLPCDLAAQCLHVTTDDEVLYPRGQGWQAQLSDRCRVPGRAEALRQTNPFLPVQEAASL